MVGYTAPYSVSQSTHVRTSLQYSHLKTIIPIPGDPLIHAEKIEFDTVVVPFIDDSHCVSEDCGIFSARGGDGDFFTWVKEGVGNYSIVDFGFEDVVETFLAEFLRCFGALLLSL